MSAPAATLSGFGTFFAWEFDDHNGTNLSITGLSTVFANEFDDNTSSTLTSDQRMRVTSSPTGNVIVFSEINEIDAYGVVPTDGLELHLDSVDSNVIEVAKRGQELFTTSGTFVVPAGITQVSAVAVGGGGGGGNATDDDEPGAGGAGGGLSYGTFAVTAGESLTVTVGAGGNNGNTGGTGGTTSINRGGTTLISAGGGSGGSSTDGGASGGGNGGSSGGTERDGGGTGGDGGSTSDSSTGAGGGGGAAGYSGNGGAGSNRGANNATAGAGGGGGGGGGGTGSLAGGGGGGVGVLGEGSNGAAGTNGTGGGGGSGGATGATTTNSVGGSGGLYGGGGAGGRNNNDGGDGVAGAARIIFGTGRFYPSTNTEDAFDEYTWEDISGNNRDAQFKNITDNPKEGNFIDFNSANNEYALLDGTYLGSSLYNGVTGTAARTSIVFVKADSGAENYRILSWGDNTGGQSDWVMRMMATNQFRLELEGGYAEESSTNPINVNDGNWHMITVTMPVSGIVSDIRMWFDGVEDTNLIFSNPSNAINTGSANNVSVGANLSGGTISYLNGQIAKVMIYSRELTDLEIKLIYRSILLRLLGY